MRKLLALALLPANCIADAFHHLVNTADADIVMYFQNLLAYYKRQWITKVKPQGYSVYNEIHRTNNPLEAYHRILGEMMGFGKIIWIFTETILDFSIKAKREIFSVRQGLQVRRLTENKYILSAAMIEKAWELFVRNKNTIQHEKFLTALSHILDKFRKDLICANVNVIQGFENDLSDEEICQLFADEIHVYRIENIHGVVRRLHRTGCLLCRCKFLATHFTLPCFHWYGCQLCTQNAIHRAAADNNDLICPECHIVCQEFSICDKGRQIGKLKKSLIYIEYMYLYTDK